MFLGGTFVPKNYKRPKVDIPVCSEVVCGLLNIYSCKTSTRDDRCLVIKDERDGTTSVICENHYCKETRAVMVNSNSLDLFKCDHIACLKSASPRMRQYFSMTSLDEY